MWVSTQEAGRRLGRSTLTVRRYIDTGKLRGTKRKTNRYAIRVTDLDRFIAARAQDKGR